MWRLLNLEQSNWKFDSSVVPVFDEHVRQSVPMYDEIHNLITDIAGWFLEDDTNVYDIGTSTGKVISCLNNKYTNKVVNYIGIDSSEDMVAKTKEQFKNDENKYIINQDITDNFIFENASLITSVLTLQFVPERKRQELVNNIFKGLNKGCAFILVEKVIGNNPRFNEIWIDLYHELKLKNGLSEQHIFAKAKAIRGVMKPYTVDENMELLHNAGFKDMDIFFKWNNFVGFVAIK
jgi:tRNA (cmo5U34)-methyltransferase